MCCMGVVSNFLKGENGTVHKKGKWHDVLYTCTSVPVMEKPVAGGTMCFSPCLYGETGKGVKIV